MTQSDIIMGLLFKLLKSNVHVGGPIYELKKDMYSKSKCFRKLKSKRTETFPYLHGSQTRLYLESVVVQFISQ